ncbi:hypothetical protein Tco_0707292 [Tanacetum coccineum]|uniref:Integrase, catalytic region, zinc finger, CCHC-type, peptidase aspartic, catalytic n=1 Tax=Tanacetum coccineum TaxID=301880 RepID=A0ABQ4YAW9_9ASTR
MKPGHHMTRNPFEVQDHDTFVDHMDEYHEVHEMQNDVQHNYVYGNDALMSILDEMHEQCVQSRLANKPDMVVNDSVTSELARYKELEAPDFNSFFKIKNLEYQIQEKDNVIRNLKVLVANVNDRSCEPYNAKDVTALIEQNDCVRIELEKVKQHYKELYDSIKITRAHTSEKTSTMLNEIESLKAQLRSKEPCFTSDYVKPKVLAPGMYAIDVKPIPHPLKNNRSAHLNYIIILKESVETVRRIELLEYVIGTCPKSFNERDNKAPSTPVTRKKQVTEADLETKRQTSDNSFVQRPSGFGKLRENYLQILVINEPTGKETHPRKLDCSTQWSDPHETKYTLGEMCHLTKLSVKCCSKHMTGNRSKLMNFVEKFIGSVRFGNDHLGSIMGQFCDSDLEVAFRKHTCFVYDIKGINILKGSHGTNLYTISIDEMMKSSPICLLSKASKSKSWLWHRRLNHLKTLARIMILLEKIDQSMAPVRMSSGPAPFIMTPGQLKSGLTPTDKELEMLFQPMFDEHLEQSQVNEPVPSATDTNAQVVPPVQHQEIIEDPIHEDTPINHDVLHPSHNLGLLERSRFRLQSIIPGKVLISVEPKPS